MVEGISSGLTRFVQSIDADVESSAPLFSTSSVVWETCVCVDDGQSVESHLRRLPLIKDNLVNLKLLRSSGWDILRDNLAIG